MGIQLVGFQESSEERQLRLRRQTFQRIRILTVICVVAILARVFIKNPEPPKPPDISKEAIRYVPGMLDALPSSTLSKMDPILLARLQKAEMEARKNRYGQSPAYAKGDYKPAETPLPNSIEEEAIKQLVYAYAKKQKNRVRQSEAMAGRDLTKTFLVQFARGGYLKAEKAQHRAKKVEISVDRTMVATLPHHLVKSVSENALMWKEPIPRGFVQIKPAKGITITIAAQSAKRISIQKPIYDES